MKILSIIIVMIALASLASAQNYQIDWHVIGSGGGESGSSNYTANGTIGQPFTEQSSSSNYIIESGFWVGSPIGGGCDYVVGDANSSGTFNGLDVTYGVAYFKGGPPPPFICECPPHGTWYVSGDVNASCSYNGLDITYAVSYFKGGPSPNPCAACPPGGSVVAGVKIIKSKSASNSP
jgi:hypothetical protein